MIFIVFVFSQQQHVCGSNVATRERRERGRGNTHTHAHTKHTHTHTVFHYSLLRYLPLCSDRERETGARQYTHTHKFLTTLFTDTCRWAHFVVPVCVVASPPRLIWSLRRRGFSENNKIRNNIYKPKKNNSNHF